MNKRKRRKNYKFSDDRMFCSVLASNVDLAKQFIETILNVEIDSLVCTNAQQVLNYEVDIKSVRFDVMLAGSDAVYDIEIETTEKDFKVLPIRAGYYGSAAQAAMAKTGMNYSDMKNVFIIFICKSDPFNRGLARYTGEVMCREDPTVDMRNRITYIYLNAAGKMETESAEMKSLLRYIADRKHEETSLTQALQAAVKQYNEDENWRMRRMTFEEKLNAAREEGRTEERNAAVVRMINKGLSDAEIMGYFPEITVQDLSDLRRS